MYLHLVLKESEVNLDSNFLQNRYERKDFGSVKYSDEQRIEKILNYAIKLQDYVAENNVTKERLMTEESLQWLVTTPLYHICEQIYDLSKNFTEKYSNIEWKKFSSLYYGLAHNYDEINWNDISEIIVDLPIFTKQMEEVYKKFIAEKTEEMKGIIEDMKAILLFRQEMEQKEYAEPAR